MSSYLRRDEALRAWCAQTHADDGVNPKDDKRRQNKSDSKADRKLQQLCKQVSQILELELASLPCAPLLSQTAVVAVMPAPNAGRLNVLVGVHDPAMRTKIELALQQHAGRLRMSVATAITRKRAPELVFTVIKQRSHDDE